MKNRAPAFLIIFGIVLLISASVYGYQTENSEYIIYNNFAYVIESREIHFNTGTHSYTLTDFPSSIRRESIFIDNLTRGISILQQQFDSNVFNFSELLNNYRGRSMALILLDGQEINGIFYGISGNDFVLRNGDSFTAVNRSRVNSFVLDGISGSAPFKPSLHIFATSSRNEQAKIRVHYLADSIGWTGEYVGVYNPERKELQVRSWARIRNNSDKDIRADSIILIAGEPHSAGGRVPIYPQQRFAAKTQELSMTPDFQVEEAHIFHKYTLDQPINLESNREQQVTLFPESDITVEDKFVFNVNKFGEKVMNIIEFINDRSSGFRGPVPSGIVRLFQENESGSLFIGEDRIANTPLDGRIELQLGVAFDITGKRIQKQFRRIGERSREETYEIELQNAGSNPEEVIIYENFSGEWRILDSTVDYNVIDARTAEFKITVPSEGKFTFSYSVRYF